MNSTPHSDYHLFRFSRANIDAYFPEKSFQEVISTEAFRRLGSIHFLGAIDYLMLGGQFGVERRHTRFDHSLGVASLVKRFARAKGLRSKEYETVVIAGLLHDIGHAPLSHSLEPAFRSIFEIDHHRIGERILRGEVKLGARLARAFERNEINNFEVMSLIAGVGAGIGRELFSRSINVDTIEGIIRSASYLHRKEVVISPILVMDAFIDLGRPSQEVLDHFWMIKDHVYSSIIQSKKGLVADYLCKRYMEINSESFRPHYYYDTEPELRKNHKELFDSLEDLGRQNIIWSSIVKDGEKIRFTKRRFFIDKSVVLRSYRDLDRRYLQSKEKVMVEIRKTGGDDAHNAREHPESQDLF